MITGRQNNVLDILKGLLPMLVVAIHTSIDATLRYQDGVEPFLRVLICKIGGVAVPAFFFISGLLFFKRMQIWDWTVWEKSITKRIKSLFVPYVLWIVLAFLLKYIWGLLKHELPGSGFFRYKIILQTVEV